LRPVSLAESLAYFPLQESGFYTLGRKVMWSGVTSTSREEAVALRFAGPGGVVFRIQATSGVSVENFSVFTESEVSMSLLCVELRHHGVLRLELW
jgi:hypothetical protein